MLVRLSKSCSPIRGALRCLVSLLVLCSSQKSNIHIVDLFIETVGDVEKQFFHIFQSSLVLYKSGTARRTENVTVGGDASNAHACCMCKRQDLSQGCTDIEATLVSYPEEISGLHRLTILILVTVQIPLKLFAAGRPVEG
jgi:hypothetical protein